MIPAGLLTEYNEPLGQILGVAEDVVSRQFWHFWHVPWPQWGVFVTVFVRFWTDRHSADE